MAEIGEIVSIGVREYKVVQVNLNTQRATLREIATDPNQPRTEVTFSLRFLDELDLGRKW